jgi:hypothetical protein
MPGRGVAIVVFGGGTDDGAGAGVAIVTVLVTVCGGSGGTDEQPPRNIGTASDMRDAASFDLTIVPS